MPQRDPAVDTATARNLIFNAAAHSNDDAADERLETQRGSDERVEIDLIVAADEDERLLTPGVDSKGHRQVSILSRLSSQAQQILSPGLSSSQGTLGTRRPASRANARNACTLLLVGLTFLWATSRPAAEDAPKVTDPLAQSAGPREVAFVEHPHSQQRAARRAERRQAKVEQRLEAAPAAATAAVAPAAAATPPIAAPAAASVTPPIAAPRAEPPRAAASAAAEPPPVALDGCSYLFVDGGSNEGEAVDAFVAGNFFRCATSAPDRVYHARWPSMSKAERRAAMAPLNEPARWCVRTFEAAPELLPPLRDRERGWRDKGFDVKVVGGALANASAARAPRKVYRYGSGASAVSAAALPFGDIHVEGPRETGVRMEALPTYDAAALVRRAVAANDSATIALRLDVEGDEWWILRALVAEPALLCKISYLFVEFHGSATAAQRAKLPGYGLREDEFEALKRQAHANMNLPGCKLQLYWRSFWASCGDQQRFEWRDSKQVKGS